MLMRCLRLDDHADLSRWYDRADEFSESSGKWSYVRNNLLSAEKSIMEYFTNAHARVKRDDVCGNLAKDERNPVVEEAMKKLLEGKKGIETMYGEIDRSLADVASSLDGLAGDTTDSDITSAARKLEEVQRQYDQLDRIRGNDTEAGRRVEAGRKLATAALAMTEQLRTLKRSQFLIDKAPDACNDAATRLAQIIRGFLDSRETAGKTQIPLRARGFAAAIKTGLDKTDQQDPIMYRAQSEALRFDAPDGAWRAVKDRARASTVAMYEYWTRARNAAHKACDDLAKGDQNPAVVRAVKNLNDVQAKAENDLLRLTAEHRKWYEQLKELRQWYSQDTRNVRDAFCNLEESPGDPDEGAAYEAELNKVANRMRDRISPRWTDLKAQATQMIAVANNLAKEKDEGVSKGATKLATQIQKTVTSVSNVLNGELNGANDPEIRARIETGKNEHKRIQADSSKCTVSEQPFGRRRVDCIRVDGSACYVVEIKPNNARAIKKGRAQAEDGVEQIKGLIVGKNKKSELTDRLEIFRPCFDEPTKDIDLKWEVRVYEYCPPERALFKDFVVP